MPPLDPKHKTIQETHNIISKIKVAGIVLGIGMGGFLDGIVLHRILRLHEMVSTRYPPDTMDNIHVNMLWDGLFDLFNWVITLIGIIKLWGVVNLVTPAALFNGTVFWGSLLMGWGLFNVVEGLVNHRMLEIHHFIENLGPSETVAWDYFYLLGMGVFPTLASHFIVIRGERRVWEEHSEMRPLVVVPLDPRSGHYDNTYGLGTPVEP